MTSLSCKEEKMQNTTNFNLNKPEGTDIYNIANENDNMDIIDAALAKAHSTDDSASTDLADGDYLPFYDTSATEKKKMLLSTARKDVRARIAEAVSNDVIETIGAKALNSYSVGQYFLGNDGYYYAATAAITANTTTLNSGVSGNCSKTSIAAGMNSLSSQISNINSKIKSPATSILNIDQTTETGFYRYSSETSGTKPATAAGGVLIVLQYSSTYTSQMAIPYDSTATNPKLYIRIISSGTIGAWNLI
jgi:hypothetical protein